MTGPPCVLNGRISFKNTGKNTGVTLWFGNIKKNNLLASL
jgi:hypothetical protein